MSKLFIGKIKFVNSVGEEIPIYTYPYQQRILYTANTTTEQILEFTNIMLFVIHKFRTNKPKYYSVVDLYMKLDYNYFLIVKENLCLGNPINFDLYKLQRIYEYFYRRTNQYYWIIKNPAKCQRNMIHCLEKIYIQNLKNVLHSHRFKYIFSDLNIKLTFYTA